MLRAIFIPVVLVVLAGACTAPISGSGEIVTENRSVESFSSVRLVGDGAIYLSQDAPDTLAVRTDENLLEHIETYVQGDTLVIDTRDRDLVPTDSIAYLIQSNDFERIEIQGQGSVISEEPLYADEFAISVEGAADVTLEAYVDRLETDIAGSGTFDYTGTARIHEIDIAGSGDIRALGLVTNRTDISISGSGDALVNAQESLDVRITGSGDISYIGDPEIDQTITGSGTVSRYTE